MSGGKKSKPDNPVVAAAKISAVSAILVALITAILNPDLLTRLFLEPTPSVPVTSAPPPSTPLISTSSPKVTLTASGTVSSTVSADASVPAEEPGSLIYEETFEDRTADGIETIYGHFDIVQTADGNHAWRTEDNATSQLTLPIESTDYAISARMMQVSGTDDGQGAIWFRTEDGDPCWPSYLVYMVVLYDQVRLIEKDSDCNELQESGLYQDYYFEDSDGLSNGIWYTVRIEVKGGAVRVYWDGELIIEGEDTDGDIRRSNVIGFAACCGDFNTHTFDFDDIQVWVSDP